MSTAFVTGGTSGIGRAIVARLCTDGRQVVFTGRDHARGADVAARTGAKFIAADATDRAACDAAFDRALGIAGGDVDLLVCSAAVIYRAPLEHTPEPVLRELIEVNLTSAFRLSRAAFAAMRARGGGTMIHVVSDAGIRGLHTIPAYSITKAGMLSMSELFAAAGAAHGVRSVAVCPGATHPGVQSTATGYPDHAEDDSTWPPALAGRHGSGADVAASVAWLASGEARHVSGAVIRIDGGTGSTLLTRPV